MPFDEKARARAIRGLIVITFAAGVLLALEVFSRFLLEGSASEGPRHMVEVVIPEGATVSDIALILHKNDLIEHPILFRYAVRIMGSDTRIQSGHLMLASGQSLFDLVRNLTRAKAIGVTLTISEGRTAADIASMLQERIGVDSSVFMGVIHDSTLVHDLDLDAPSLEGYLFPDTYYFAVGTDPKRIASRMVANFRNKLPADFGAQLASQGLSLNEVITLASIIEWETMTRSEARLISSVYHNRLKRGMLLQADPTVAYALGRRPSRLYYSDLAVDSPYNTYRRVGLPPGPINNPGMESIAASLNPAQTNYLFFVSNGDGTHTFTTSLSDHLEAKKRLDALRRQLDSTPVTISN